MATTLERPRTGPRDWSPAEWEELVNALTRRRFISGGLALGLITALPGCGGDDEEPTATLAPTEPPPLRIEHLGGVTDVPRSVQRIVTMLGEEDLHAVLALGVVPVLSATWDWETSPFANQIEPVGTKAEYPLDLEAVAAAQPDLIIGSDAELEQYEQLSGIAPTVLLDRFEQSVDEHLRMVGLALGLEAEAERVIVEFERRVAEVAEQVAAGPLASASYGIAFKRVIEGELRIFGPESYSGRMLMQVGAAGLIDPTPGGEENTFGDSFSTERLNILDPAQIIILIAHPEVPEGEAISDLPNWRLLPVVDADGPIVEVPRALWYIETALTRMLRLDDIERVLEEIG